jgi:cytochrome c-type biogenesis protein CcmE
VLRDATNCNVTQAGILPDGVAVNRGIICKGMLSYLLQPAVVMAGSLLPSSMDCNSETSLERGAS